MYLKKIIRTMVLIMLLALNSAFLPRVYYKNHKCKKFILCNFTSFDRSRL